MSCQSIRYVEVEHTLPALPETPVLELPLDNGTCEDEREIILKNKNTILLLWKWIKTVDRQFNKKEDTTEK